MKIFDDARYAKMAAEFRTAYASANPFPHAVIDDFLPAEICEQILAEFPDLRSTDSLNIDRRESKKLANKEERQLSDFTRDVLAQMNSAACLRFLEELTGIGGLIGDPYFEGGGLHQIERGGFLKMHVDFNYHRRLKLDRRINLIVYLNKDWRDEYQGHLQLWDRRMTTCVRKILPVFNRCVIFNTSDWSYHGHPDRLECPQEQSRKSMALYYYSNGRPEEEKSPRHGTLWQEPAKPRMVREKFASAFQGMASLMETPVGLLRRAAHSLTAKAPG